MIKRTAYSRYFKLMLLLIGIFFTNQGVTQAVVNGSISNYQINCNDGSSCVDASTSFNARYYYVAPTDGMLSITGYASGGLINCCGSSYQMSCTGGFRKLRAPANIHMFSSSSTTGTLNCIAAGDSIELNFSGTFGTYGYVATVIPDPLPNDVEPNDGFSEAIDIVDGTNFTGHLYYGAYNSSSDNNDTYRFIAQETGSLSLNILHDEDFTISTYRNDSLYQGGKVINTNPYLFELNCLAEDDTVFLRFNSLAKCFSYQVDADFMIPSFGNDQEPNNDKSTAIASTDIYGAVGHGRNNPLQPDAQDFYELPFLNKGDNLEFSIEVMEGPVNFRLLSQSFSGFSFSIGTSTNGTLTNNFAPTFDDVYFLEVRSNTGICGDYKVNLDGCIKELFLVGSESRVMDIESDSFIVSSQSIESSAVVDYDAKHFISLESGFQVNDGAVFHAYIDGCNP